MQAVEPIAQEDIRRGQQVRTRQRFGKGSLARVEIVERGVS